MARSATSGVSADVIPLNSAARATEIVAVIKELAALDDQRAEISTEINKLKQQRIKGGLGMKIADFNMARRLYALEGGDRDELLATMRETFDALGVGSQLDWIEATNRVASGESKVPEAAVPD